MRGPDVLFGANKHLRLKWWKVKEIYQNREKLTGDLEFIYVSLKERKKEKRKRKRNPR